MWKYSQCHRKRTTYTVFLTRFWVHVFTRPSCFYIFCRKFEKNQPDTFCNLKCVVQRYKKHRTKPHSLMCIDKWRAYIGWIKLRCYICNIYSLLFRSNTKVLYNSNTYDNKQNYTYNWNHIYYNKTLIVNKQDVLELKKDETI